MKELLLMMLNVPDRLLTSVCETWLSILPEEELKEEEEEED